jgi:hypothetical protein
MPSMAHIDQLEIHHDTWNAGFTMYYDEVEFMTLSPPRLTHVALDAGGRMTFGLAGFRLRISCHIYPRQSARRHQR